MTLDALVAVRVMGWTQHTGMADCWCTSPNGSDYKQKHYFHPSTDIADAWLMVGHVAKAPDDRWMIDLYGRGHCLAVFSPAQAKDTHAVQYEAAGPTAPLAICLAALRAVGVSEQEIEEARK